MFPTYQTNELIVRLLHGEDVLCERCRKPLTYYLIGSGRPPGVFCPTGCTNESAMDKMNVLIISSDADLLAQAREAYAELGHVTLTAAGDQALSVLERRDAALSNFILVDYRAMAEPELLRLLRNLKQLTARYEQEYCYSQVVLLIGEDTSLLDVPDEIACAGVCLCHRVFDSKDDHKALWESLHTPMGVPLTNERKPWQHLLRRIFRPLRLLPLKKEQRDGSSAPPLERSAYLRTVQAAVGLARAGRTLDGRQCLLDALKRAETQQKSETWAATFVRAYRGDLDAYDRRFGLKAQEQRPVGG